MSDDKKIEIAITVPSECLKSASEVYRDNYDDIFRKNHAVEVDPITGALAEKKPAGEQ
jgi:hypothetical protein